MVNGVKPILPRTDASSSILVEIATVREISTEVCVTLITLLVVDPDTVTVTDAVVAGNVIVSTVVRPVTVMVARLPLSDPVGEIVIVCAVVVRVVAVTVSVDALRLRVVGVIVSVDPATVRVTGVTEPEGVMVNVPRV